VKSKAIATTHQACKASTAEANELTRAQLDDDAGHGAAIAAAAAKVGIPLKRLDLRAERLRDLYGAPLALVRPDQFVAWRGGIADPQGVIDTIRGSRPGIETVGRGAAL